MILINMLQYLAACGPSHQHEANQQLETEHPSCPASHECTHSYHHPAVLCRIHLISANRLDITKSLEKLKYIWTTQSREDKKTKNQAVFI